MKLQAIQANFTGVTRYDEMAGQKYLVAPMVMIVEGVLNGSGGGGSLLYTKEEMSKIPQIWNHKPVVVYHPAHNGEGCSACDPIILSNRQIGIIMNTKMVGNKLTAEAWLNESRINKVDERIAEAIETNQMMELSTGLYVDTEEVENGDWNGTPYDAIARNFRPDHLALLPDLTGACSIEDGAGFLRLNAKPGILKIINNAMSHSNIRSLLNSWIQTRNEAAWVEDVYDNFFIYELDGKYISHNYEVKDNQIEISTETKQVIRVTEWRTPEGGFVGNKTTNVKDRKESKMDKEKVVASIIAANTNSWSEADKDTLMAMNEDVLTKMQESTIAAATAVENAVKKSTEDAEAKAKLAANVKKTPKKEESTDTPETVEDYIARAPIAIGHVLTNSMATYNAQHESIVKIIMANKQNVFEENELTGKTVSELKKIAALLPVAETITDYSGQGDPASIQNFETEETAPEMPSCINA